MEGSHNCGPQEACQAFAEATRAEYESWWQHDIFDLIDCYSKPQPQMLCNSLAQGVSVRAHPGKISSTSRHTCGAANQCLQPSGQSWTPVSVKEGRQILGSTFLESHEWAPCLATSGDAARAQGPNGRRPARCSPVYCQAVDKPLNAKDALTRPEAMEALAVVNLATTAYLLSMCPLFLHAGKARPHLAEPFTPGWAIPARCGTYICMTGSLLSSVMQASPWCCNTCLSPT